MPKILFVEDDPFIIEIYGKKFRAAGIDFTHVDNGKSALRAVTGERYDLVLLDLVIPEMNGKEVLKTLREDPRYDRSLKVVIFSNLSDPEERDECFRLGADGFIPKSDFTPSESITEIRRFLGASPVTGETSASGSVGVSAADGKSAATGRAKILFIENEDVFVDLFAKRLSAEGYDVVVEVDGAAGLESALSGGFDLVIADAVLPGIGGGEIASALRRTEKVRDIPVIVLSASPVDGESFGADIRTFSKTRNAPADFVAAVGETLAAGRMSVA